METPAKTVPAAPSGSPWKAAVYVLVALAVVAGLVLAGRQAGQYVPRFAAWVDGLGVWGPVAFVVGYAVATVAFIPGSLLTLAAGAIFGLVRGTLYTLIGATLGASAAFLIARYLARGAIEKRIAGSARRARFAGVAAIDEAIGREGFRIVALLRLSPVFPFNLLNYALGLTRVRFLHFLAASIAMLPGTLLYVYYGKAAGSLAALAGDAGGVAAEKGTGYWVTLALGLAATVAVTTVITRLASRALRQQIDGQQIDEPQAGAREEVRNG